MSYTVTKLIFWLVGAAALGVAIGYLFRGRPSVVPAELLAVAAPRPTDSDELDRLNQKVERLETQLSLAVAERDHLRLVLEQQLELDIVNTIAGTTRRTGSACVERSSISEDLETSTVEEHHVDHS